MTHGEDSPIDWSDSLLSVIRKEMEESNNDISKLQVKKIRKKALKTLDLDDGDKDSKKKFKKTMKGLEEAGVLRINSEGIVTLVESKKRKKDKKEKKEKKKKKREKMESIDTDKEEESNYDPTVEKDNKSDRSSAADEPKPAKGQPCKGNPHGITRLFLGNLPFAVDEKALSEFLPDSVTHIKWITDKETGKFYGSAFIEMDSPSSAADSVAMAGEKLMNRPLKINFAPARPGDVWPPEKKVIKGGGHTTTGGQAGGSGKKAMGQKPENCTKLFIGNLSYEIDDDGIFKFFDNVGAEVKAVRWLSHRDTGDFKGCGFVEFWNSEACGKAATLNGKNLLGRPIRTDWTD